MNEEMKTLYGASGVPVTVRKLSGRLESTQAYAFGVDRTRTVMALRALADAMERGEVVLQDVKRTVNNRLDDFEMTTLAVTYAQKY